MNATLNIIVRVNASQANQALAAQTAQIRALQKSMTSGAGSVSSFGGAMRGMGTSLEGFGKNLQWTGRQLQYNFTLPILLAGAAATKFALDNERAMTGVIKVYGQAGMSSKQINSELKDLRVSFRLLSDTFGVAQKDVIGIAESWAQAGVSGVALARITKETMQAMIIGEMDAKTATEGLIAVQAAYGLNTKQLHTALAQMNEIENETSIRFSGLIDVVTRAGGSARVAGVDIRHLSAMAATLVPAAGSAAQAGNSLKTIFSRLLAPTKQASDVLAKMGINIYAASWQAKNGVQRIESLSTAFSHLTQGQKVIVSSIIGTRFQINKFDVLMNDMAKALDHNAATHSTYQKALDATSTKTKDAAGNIRFLSNYANELNTYLGSTPQRFKILTTQIQNSLASAIMPLLPALSAALYRIVSLTQWFSKLSPQVQQFAISGLLLLAVIGPLTKYFGAFATLGGLLMSTMGNLIGYFFGNAAAAGAYATELDLANLSMGQTLKLSLLQNGILGTTFLLMKGLITLPFRLVWGGFSLIGTAIMGIGAASGRVFAGLLQLLPGLVAGLSKLPGIIGAALSGLPAFVSKLWTTILIVWDAGVVAVGNAMMAIPVFVDKVWTTILILWDAGVVAIGQMMIGIPVFVDKIWTTILIIWDAGVVAIGQMMTAIPIFVDKVWTTILIIWDAGVVAIGQMMTAIPIFVDKVWTTILIIWDAGVAAIGSVMAVLPVIVDQAWTTMLIIWDAGVAAMSASMVALPAFVQRVWTTILIIWDAGVAAIGVVTSALIAIFEGIPQAIAIAMEAAKAIWAAGIGAMEVLTAGFEAFMGLMPQIIAAAFEAPWVAVGVAAVAGITAIVIALHDQIGNAIQWVIDQFNRLPQGVVDAFSSVIQVISKAVLAVYDWLSYLNPFATHSPSLVSSVQNGVNQIAQSYGSLNHIGDNFRQAINDMEAFKKASASFQTKSDNQKVNATSWQITATAGPGAASAYLQMNSDVGILNANLSKLNAIIGQQDIVVTAWKVKLDAANNALDVASVRLKNLTTIADMAKSALDNANQTLSTLASTPIEGMKAMGDEIFANEMAQKRLQLQMLRMGSATGGIDAAKSKLAALAGQIETLSSKRMELRQAGAGSDILGTYDRQIKDLQNQQGKIQTTVNPLDAMQAKLDALQRKAQELDLIKALKFDPLQHKIQDVTNTMKEMPFNQLYAKIVAQKLVVADLQAVWEHANGAVSRQQAVVDRLTASRDAIARTYDAEKAKLDTLKQSYSDIEAQINSMTSAMSNFASTASNALLDAQRAAKVKKGPKQTEALKQFGAAGAGDFAVPGGNKPSLGREPGSIADFNKQMQAELDKTSRSLGKLDMFKPFKDLWKKGWGWVKDNVVPVTSPVWNAIMKAWHNLHLDFGDVFQKGGSAHIVTGIKNVLNSIQAVISKSPIGRGFRALERTIVVVAGAIRTVFRTIRPVLVILGNAFIRLGHALGTELKKWAPLFKPFIEAVTHVWNVLFTLLKIVAYIIGAIVAVITLGLGPIVKNVIRPIFDAIITVVTSVLGTLRGVIKFFLDLINGDWGKLWGDLVLVVSSIWNGMVGIIKAGMGVIWGVIKGVWETIVGVFQWVYDVLLGHSIIPDLVNGIKAAFEWLGKILGPIVAGIGAVLTGVWRDVVHPVFTAISAVIRNVLAPSFSFLGKFIGLEFKGIKIIFLALWRTVINPVFMAIKAIIQAVVIPIFRLLLIVVKLVWAGIKAAITGAWAVLKVIWTAIKATITAALVKPFQALERTVGSVWRGIHQGISRAWSIVRPIFAVIYTWLFGKLSDGFHHIKDVVHAVWGAIQKSTQTVWDKVASIIRHSINLGIAAVNLLIRGLNLIGKILPGFHFKIATIPHLAQGGELGRAGLSKRKVGGGFSTNMPRAIVGEGSALHPEFVIPTDPKYRQRAWGLVNSLVGHMGHRPTNAQGDSPKRMASGGTIDGIPRMAFGGIIPSPSDIWDSLKNAGADVLGAIRKGAVTAAFAPINVAVDQLTKRIPWRNIGYGLKQVKDRVYDWAKGSNKSVDNAVDSFQARQMATYGPGGIGPIAGGVMERALATIRYLESRNNYSARNPVSSASGAYQFTDPTWGGFGGYARAYLAPSAVQDQKARINIQTILSKYHNIVEAIPAAWYAGSYRGHGQENYHPGGPGNPLTVQAYMDRWMQIYNSTDPSIIPQNGTPFNGDVSRAVNWGMTQLGKPYIWGGVGPAGYDCTGFASALTNVAMGRNPYSRLFTSYSLVYSNGAGLFNKNGHGALQIGAENHSGAGHAAMTLNGINFESTPPRTKAGPTARGAYDQFFDWHGSMFKSGGILGDPGRTWKAGQKVKAYVDGRLQTVVFPGFGEAKRIDASLAAGGRIIHRPGGAILNVGEGRSDEAIQVLPIKDGNSTGGNTYVSIDNMVFPNITDPNDAHRFVRNLKNLVG